MITDTRKPPDRALHQNGESASKQLARFQIARPHVVRHHSDRSLAGVARLSVCGAA
jgi:hypothetical protein